MRIDADTLARRVTQETGLPFGGRLRPDGALVLSPEGYPKGRTFDLVVTVGWRSIEVRFVQGAFSGDLVRMMGQADIEGRVAFLSVLEVCESDDATVTVRVNDGPDVPSDALPWDAPWKTFALNVRRGQLPLGTGSVSASEDIVAKWTARVGAAVLGLLPLEEKAGAADPGAMGLPEGALSRIEVNRYERDRRNRAAALAIHGWTCRGCDVVLTTLYGEAAIDFIEVHHVTPVSKLGANYRIDPRTDLIPLCPNCHGVAHRKTPPYSVSEIREMIARTKQPRV